MDQWTLYFFFLPRFWFLVGGHHPLLIKCGISWGWLLYLRVIEKGYYVHNPTINNIFHISLIVSFMVDMSPLKIHLSVVP
jgi:hypothetical protein